MKAVEKRGSGKRRRSKGRNMAFISPRTPLTSFHSSGYGQLVTLCNNNKQYFNYRNWIMSQSRRGGNDVTCWNWKLAPLDLLHLFTMCCFSWTSQNKYKMESRKNVVLFRYATERKEKWEKMFFGGGMCVTSRRKRRVKLRW